MQRHGSSGNKMKRSSKKSSNRQSLDKQSLFKRLMGVFLNKYFMKFVITGILATILNYGVFYVLLQFFGVYYLISSSTGYISGVLLGFYINKKWTYESKTKAYKKEIAQYFVVYLISLLVGLGILKLEVSVLHIHPLIANVFMIGVTTIMNFLGTRYFVFRETKKKK
jgi:putative flippase GtrA